MKDITAYEMLLAEHRKMRKNIAALIDKAYRHHNIARHAYGRYAMVQGGSTTGKREYATYERNAIAFDDAIEKIKALVSCEKQEKQK